MSGASCTICGLLVYATDGRNVLATQEGNEECEAPYWVVRDENGRAVGSFFGWVNQTGTGEERATKYAAMRSGYTAVAIEPHGHQVRK